jgi:DNA uptake protein ComE-like DNA-binding protein
MLTGALTALLIGAMFVSSSGASAQVATPPATMAATTAATCASPVVAAGTPAATMAATMTATTIATMAATQAAEAQATFAKFNLNTATQEQLMTIPGFNSRWVREFMEYRPYVSILQFRKELGKYTDAAQITEWEKYVYVPVQVNDSDKATLMQIPCVTDAIAASLVDGRPYKTNDDFLAALAKSLTADQVAAAKNYLTTP